MLCWKQGAGSARHALVGVNPRLSLSSLTSYILPFVRTLSCSSRSNQNSNQHMLRLVGQVLGSLSSVYPKGVFWLAWKAEGMLLVSSSLQPFVDVSVSPSSAGSGCVMHGHALTPSGTAVSPLQLILDVKVNVSLRGLARGH